MEHLQTVQEIFQDKLLKVPDYQRGYAWLKEHWEEMIEDIELMEDNQEHYTGTLVIHADNSNGKIYDDERSGFSVYNIVDGQQRLTTVSIILIVLTRELDQLGEQYTQQSQGIRRKYICTTKDGIELPKLTLNRDSNDFYRKNIISAKTDVSGANIMSEQRLQDAKTFFTDYFKQKREELGNDYYSWLDKTFTKISSNLKLTVYVVPQESEVGIIFEVMNNRGKKLTETEKVKNYLLYVVTKLTCSGGPELAREINETWTYIFESLMDARAFSAEHENQLLRNNWLMFSDYNPKNWNGSKSIKEKFSLKIYKGNHEELRDLIREYVYLLKNSCTAYCDLIAPRQEKAFSKFLYDAEIKMKVAALTEKLLRIGAIASFVPLLMAIRIKHPDNLELYRDYLELCEKFACRVYRFAERRSNTGQTTLFRFAFNLFHGYVSTQKCFENIQGLLLYYAPTHDFEEDIDAPGEDWYSWYGLKYILYEYELYLASGEPVEMSWEYLNKKDKQDTIEHILPQTPTKKYWKTRWSNEQIKEAKNDLGNLTLTFNNSAYGNKGFDQKKGSPGEKNCYANSSLFMERALAQYEEWTYREYMERRNEIVAWIKERWSVGEEGEKLDIALEEDMDLDEIAAVAPENQ